MKFLLLALLASAAVAQPPAVTTKSFDNARTGANTHETQLTAASVLACGIHRITTIPLAGDARGMEGQPLIQPGVSLPDGSTHDVMVLPSMANVVRGVDAETGAALWQTTLGRPVDGGPEIDIHGINQHWGVLSTGVLDPETSLVYLVAWVSPDGTPQRAQNFLFTLRVTDGGLAGPGVLVTGSSGTQVYASAMRKQRSSLVMTVVGGRKTIFWASGTIYENSTGASGWVMAYDVASRSISASLAMSQGLGAGIWMGGQGLAANPAGHLFAITGNGSFNGVNDFGESFVKILYTPPAAARRASLRVVSWWSPYSDAGRVGENPQLSAPGVTLPAKVSGVSAPTERAMPVGGGMDIAGSRTKLVLSPNGTPLVYPATPSDPAWSDEDLGSGGGTLIPQYQVYVGGGKDGIAYAVRTGNLGNTQPADFANAARNCAKLASPPVWAAFSPGPVPSCPQDPTVLNFMPWGKTRHLHATPVQYWSPTRGLELFFWGENSNLHAWTMNSTGAMRYLAEGKEYASIESVQTPGGMPGGFCTLSSNGSEVGSAVLWCTIPYGNANADITNGRLLAYDPETLAPDGSLRVLWDSQNWGLTFLFNKFNPPIAWNGRVYVPNYNGGVDVYGQ